MGLSRSWATPFLFFRQGVILSSEYLFLTENTYLCATKKRS